MNRPKGLVLDANILIRAVFGERVRQILETYEDAVAFYAPDVCFLDAARYIPEIAQRRNFSAEIANSVLLGIRRIVQPVDRSLYEEYEQAARERIDSRDADDWPVVALALLLDVPIWTEDQDFFGAGIATWTTDRVQLYLQD